MALVRYLEAASRIDPVRRTGSIRRVAGQTLECGGLDAGLGSLCEVRTAGGRFRAEVAGFREESAILLPLGDVEGVAPGDEVRLLQIGRTVPSGDGLLGRVIDSEGRPLDDGPALRFDRRVPLHRPAPGPMERLRIREAIGTGVRAIDALATCGRGQRLGLFSGSGVGKSVLLGMIARHTAADVTVLALVGERGREVREFVEEHLGPEGLRRAVVVAETAERPAPLRARAAFAATAIAEEFRDRGRHVVLLVDSLTRVASAQREIGLSAGEPPATKGYPPSVFSMLPRLLERAGVTESGSITGIYSVLVEGDDLSDPVSDASRSVLDGHVVLSRELANRGQFPAMDPLGSVSRLMPEVVDEAHRRAARRVTSMLAVHRDAEDLIRIGAYKAGADADLDRAIRALPALRAFLRQDLREGDTLAGARERLVRLAEEYGGES